MPMRHAVKRAAWICMDDPMHRMTDLRLVPTGHFSAAEQNLVRQARRTVLHDGVLLLGAVNVRPHL